MTAYALTSKIGSDQRSIVNLTTGDRFEFPPEDGPMLAEMLDGEFPACESCEDRESKCSECGRCSDCDDDEPACWACPDYQDDEDDDEPDSDDVTADEVSDPDGVGVAPAPAVVAP